MDELKAYFRGEWGRQRQLATALGISASSVKQWKQVPAERVLSVEKHTGVSRHDLRPDLYPRENS